ncbi:MAG TPA: AAA family ATPase [Burkholderiales bacterium]|jgi:transitional endoplasmic reticulum ATPase|nr:AAA family ATPase [Burkholderiales bacterium]
MYIKLIADRLKSELTNVASRSLVHIDPEVMESRGLAVGTVVRIGGAQSKYAVPARVGEAYEADRGSRVIRLDRFVRTATKAKINEEVEISVLGEVSELESVTLMPPIDVSTAHHLIEHLRESFVENRTPLGRGSVVYATFHDSTAGTTYRVVKCVPEVGVVCAATKIHVEIPSAGGIKADEQVGYEDVGGMQSEIKLIRELVQLPLQFPQVYRQLGIVPPRGIIFYGPPGSGKTYLARAIANEVHAGFYYINGPDVVGTLYGETESNLRKIFAEAAHHAPSIVLIDELDAIAPHREKSGAQSDVRMVTQLLSLLDGLMKVDGLVVIGTTNRVDAIDVAMRRPGRFDREIFLGPPDAAGRLDILKIHTREMPLAEAALEHLPKVAEVTHGFVGADLMELCREAGLNSLRRSSSALLDHLSAFRLREDMLEVEPRDFDDALAKVRPSAIREAFVTIPDVSWSDVGGLAEVKEQLKNNVERPLKSPEVFRAAGIATPNGILLYGPPGTGKTLIAKALAKECGVNFLAMDGPEVFTKWLGESEEAIRHIFRVARQLAPSIVFFDQLDALAPLRSADSGSRTTERVVNQLLAELDGMEVSKGNVIVIAATNRIDLVDPSVLRLGRLGVHLFVPLPGTEERAKIFAAHLRGARFGADRERLYARLAAETEGLSGADIQAVCVQAKMNALKRAEYGALPPLTEADFSAAIRRLGAAAARKAA